MNIRSQIKSTVNCFFIFLTAFSFFIFHSSISNGQVKCIPDSAYYATYFGSDDLGFSIAHDKFGNTYITGRTGDSTTSIATKSAFQTSFGGGREDGFLAKFNCEGGLAWATYFGGRGLDEGDALTTDDSGNVYLAGQTTSAAGIATKGAYQTSLGNANGFIAKFNTDGVLKWATYYGGGSSGITSDKTTGSVYLTGNTYSSTGIATSGAYQTNLWGTYDAYLAKFSPAGSLLWGTFYGGTSGYTGGTAVALDSSGDVYFTGITTSYSGLATSGAYKTSGDSIWDDVFLAKFSSSGSRLWATYYGGTDLDASRAVATDGSNVYITGSTRSVSGIATAGAYQTSYSGGVYMGDAFIAKFNGSGSLIWATYYGGSNDDAGDGINIDGIGNVYLAGQTNSLSGIATKNAYQDTGNSLNGAAFVARFSSSGVLEYGTYFGNENYASALSIDNTGNEYITGDGYILPTSGAFQTSSSGLFWAKIPIPLINTSTGFSPISKAITDITFYPNPTTSILNIESGANIIQSFTIFDAMGKEFYTLQKLNSQNQSINVNNFPSGIYIIKLGLENGNYIGKFVKD